MSQKTYILALDQGTTSSRSILLDESGKICAQSNQELTQHYPKPGWVEHDPLEIWSSQLASIEAVLLEAGIDAESIAAIGIANQRETTLVWDRHTGEPIYNAIVWQDRRTADFCRQLKDADQELTFKDKTGLRLDPYFSGTKLHWLLNNVKGARARAEKGELIFGTVNTWLLWKLTAGKVHTTDATNACRTLLYNLDTGDWDEALCKRLDIPRAMLPAIRTCSEVYGKVAAEVKLLAGVAIAGMAGDQHAALFGQACFDPGMVKNTYGTGCFMLMHTGSEAIRSNNNLLTTVAWQIGDETEYALEGSIFVGGAVVQWLRDELELVESVEELNLLASNVPDSNGLILVPAFTGLGAPHWDPYAQGLAIGITRGTKRAHFCRAALESIAYQGADLLEAMEKDSGLHTETLRVDGGAARSDLMLQFQADLLQTEVQRPSCIETTALGAAYLAGLAVGYWKDRSEIAEIWQIERSFFPKRTKEQMEPLKAAWGQAVERSKAWKTD